MPLGLGRCLENRPERTRSSSYPPTDSNRPMAYFVELQFAAKTDTGLLRPHNEDSIEVGEESGIAILADGMGGYNAGEVASSIAVAVIKEALQMQLRQFKWNGYKSASRPIQHIVADSIGRANASILDVARADPQYSGMGTTVIAAVFHHDRLVVGHVGDSRLYRLRDQQLVPLTRDHSLLQEQIDAGMIDPEQARFSPQRNLITRAVGIDHGLEVEVSEHQTRRDDLYLLCSDGLSDMLSPQELLNILKGARAGLGAAAERLIEEANLNGGRDNISAILVRIKASKPEAAAWRRLWNLFLKAFDAPLGKRRPPPG